MFLSDNMRFLRKQAGLTQADLAAKLGLKRPVIGAYEEGRAEPRLQTLQLMARYFNKSIDDLLTTDLSTGLKAVDFSGRNLRVLSIAVDRSDTSERATIVPVKAAAGYLEGFGDLDYIGSLPHFSMPFAELPADRTYRIFQIAGESMLPILPGAYVISEYVQDWTNIKSDGRYVLLTRDDGIVFKRMRPLDAGKVLELHSENTDFQPYKLNWDQILEVWKALGVINFKLDSISERPDVAQIRLVEAIERLEGRVRNLEKK